MLVGRIFRLAGRGVLRALPIIAAAMAILPAAPKNAVAECSTAAEQDQFGACLDIEPSLQTKGSVYDGVLNLRRDSVGADSANDATLIYGAPANASAGDSADEALSSTIPVSVTPDDTGFAARASTKMWRDQSILSIAKRVEAVKAASKKDLKIPDTAVRREPSVDMWSTVDVRGASGDGDTSMRTGVGVDYKAGAFTTMGVAAERGEATSALGGAQADEKFSAYVNLKAMPAFSIDTRTEWSAATSNALDGAEGSEKGAILVAPRVSHSFQMGDKTTLEPFVNYKKELEVITSGAAISSPDTVGAGLTYAKQDDFSVSVTTDLEGLSDAAEQNVNSRLQLKLPLP